MRRTGPAWPSCLVVVVMLGLAAVALPAHAREGLRPAPVPPIARAQAGATPTVTATLIPGGPPPGVRNPLQGALAVAAIIVTAAAGIFIYRVIRNGL